MLTELAANRANMSTAANPACLWLFPGGRAGQLLAPGMLAQFRAPGVAAIQTRAVSFRQLVLEALPRSSRVVSATARNRHLPRHRRRGTWHRYPATRAGS